MLTWAMGHPGEGHRSALSRETSWGVLPEEISISEYMQSTYRIL
jgi:hypothetical protein